MSRDTPIDPCGNPPLHIPTAEETFEDLIVDQAPEWAWPSGWKRGK